MIKFNLRMHDLDCAEEVVSELHKRWGKDVEINFTASSAAMTLHSTECNERREAGRATKIELDL